LAFASDLDLSPACVDANQLELAILNLTINARDAMPGGGSLRIDLQNSRTGNHSPPGCRREIMSSYRSAIPGPAWTRRRSREHSNPSFTSKELGIGSGLGLPMVQGFTAQSGGAVQIRSQLGEGTTVEFWLPQTNRP
jgi:signal transduction histidine kinase